MKDFLTSLWVRPVNSKGEELSSNELCRWTRRWLYELTRRARTDDDAKWLLMGLTLETVEAAASVSRNDRFNAHAKAFIEALTGKQPTQSNKFREEWLFAGLLHAEGIKVHPDGYEIRSAEEMTKLAITALEDELGEDWQDHESVADFFTGKRRKTPLGMREWETMDKGERREVVRKTLRTAARTWRRQADKIRAKKLK